MGDELVAKEIKIYPIGRAATFRAAEQTAVKAARRSDVVNRESKMEQRNSAHDKTSIKIVSG
jgi:hypothetical protein